MRGVGNHLEKVPGREGLNDGKQRMTAPDTVNTVLDCSGIAKDSVHRDKLAARIARHLKTIRNRSAETALASLATHEATQ